MARIGAGAVALVFAIVALAGCAAPDSVSGGESAGDALVEQLHAAYGDRPYQGGQETPDHEWTVTNAAGTRIAFLHWMPETKAGEETGGDPEQADVLFATGVGFKGNWCKGDGGVTQDQIDDGYVHFHKETSAQWDAGHGGDNKDQVGFWLIHIAAIDGAEMMPGVVSEAGEVYPLMPTTDGLPDC